MNHFLLLVSFLLLVTTKVCGSAATSTTVLWADAFYQGPLGLGGVVVADNDGTSEILLTMSPGFWKTLAYDKQSQSYETAYVSEVRPLGICSLFLADLVGDETEEIVTVRPNSEIRIYDQKSKNYLKTLQAAPGFNPRCAIAYNLDNTGKDELLLCSLNKVSCLSNDGVLLWEVPGAFGFDITCGQMDNDPGYEVATSMGQVVDVVTKAIQRDISWEYEPEDGLPVDCADIDSDGIDELVSAGRVVTAYDVENTSAKWVHNLNITSRARSITIRNTDSDLALEIITDRSHTNSVYCFDSITLAKEWEATPPIDGVYGCDVGDVDGDDEIEVIWTTWPATNGAALYVYSPGNNSYEHSTLNLDGPLEGPCVGDLDGDGYDEVVVGAGTTNGDYGPSRIVVYDYLTHKVRAVSPQLTSYNFSDVLNIDLVDINNDSKLEILAVTAVGYDGLIKIYELTPANVFRLVWESPLNADHSFSTAAVQDVDGDKDLEVVGATNPYNNLYIYDINTAALESRTSYAGSEFEQVQIANIDSDPAMEIIVRERSDFIRIIDGATRIQEAEIPGLFTSFDIVDKVIHAGTLLGYIEQYEFTPAGTYARTSQTKPSNYAIAGLTIESTSPLTMWISYNDRQHLLTNGNIISETASYGAGTGKRYDRKFANGFVHLLAYKLPSPEVDAEPETTSDPGNTISWSRVYVADEYLVEASADPDFTTIEAESGWIPGLQFTFDSLQRGRQYYFRCKCRKGDPAAESMWSRPVTSFQVPIALSAFSLE